LSVKEHFYKGEMEMRLELSEEVTTEDAIRRGQDIWWFW
jgi:hypothetical protein